MAKSVKPTNNTYIDSTGVVHNRKGLNTIIEKTYNLDVTKNDIPSNSDLNNYTIPGTYKCLNSSVGSTLSNCPFTTGPFKLVVEYLANEEKIKQTIYTNLNTGDTYTRIYNGSWRTWFQQSNYYSLQAVYKQTNVWNQQTYDTGISVNAAAGGATYLVCYSAHNSTGDHTRSTIYMLRCGHSGNNYKLELIKDSNGTNGPSLPTFSVNSSGNFCITKNNTNEQHRYIIYKLT